MKKRVIYVRFEHTAFSKVYWDMCRSDCSA
jgi:hypothetical protein